MRWNPNRAADLLSSRRTALSDMAARTAQHDTRQILLPAALPTVYAPDEEERLVDDWLRLVSQPASSARPAPPGDFTARVMARLDAGPVVAPQPLPRSRVHATMVERFCIVGSVFGVSILLVAATCLLTVLLAPSVILSVLNVLVAGIVSVLLLLGPLFDALNALAANPSLMCAFLVLIAGALALWSRVLYPAARLAGEA